VGDEQQQRDDDKAAADPEERTEEACDETDEDQPHRRILGPVSDRTLLDELAREPARAALCLDVDGVLAPIVERPEDAAVPEETRVELRRLVARYALVAAISGRASEDARRIVGVPRLVYVGSHGLELSPDAERWRVALQMFLASVDWPVENKGLTASFHYRTATDETAAKAELDTVASRAEQAGLRARYGRKVLEILPPIEADKGTAVHQLLAERQLTRALYAGDDTTDLDGFAALDGLEIGVRVAVASGEGPVELRERADVIVDGSAELLELLRRL
jgi:trehalose 6-phosphate phosphatase